MKRQGEFPLPSGWDASLSQGYSIKFASTHFDTYRVGERHCESRVKWVVQEHMHRTMSPPPPVKEMNPGPLNLETSALAMRPPSLKQITLPWILIICDVFEWNTQNIQRVTCSFPVSKSPLGDCEYQENHGPSDKWNIPWYTMREHCITILYHEIAKENTVVHTGTVLVVNRGKLRLGE